MLGVQTTIASVQVKGYNMPKDVAFQINPTNAFQTVMNVVGSEAAAALNSGQLGIEDLSDWSAARRAELFEEAMVQVEKDNAALKEAFDNAPEKTYNKTKKEQPEVPLGEDAFTWGKPSVKGKTIATVYTEEPSYLDWLVNKDTNPARNFMRDRARKYIDSLKAGVS